MVFFYNSCTVVYYFLSFFVFVIFVIFPWLKLRFFFFFDDFLFYTCLVFSFCFMKSTNLKFDLNLIYIISISIFDFD
jgi:hypothetical protein